MLNKTCIGINKKKLIDFLPMSPGHSVPSSIFTEDLGFALMGRMSDLRPIPSFYLTEKEKIHDLEYLFDINWKTDPEYVYAITYFIANEMGMRLSPTLSIARIIYNEDGNSNSYQFIEKLIKKTFNRPDFFANLVLYYKAMTKKYIYFWKTGWASQLFPEWAVKILRNHFEDLEEHTLKSQKLNNKMLKTKHLIIGFRPKPKNDKMSKLYKAIIEGTKESKLQIEIDNKTGKIKADHIRSVLSSDLKNHQKREYISNNINNIPINALIRNLKQIDPKDSNKLFLRLDNAFTNAYTRFINPFDLLHIKYKYDTLTTTDIDPEIKSVCSRILQKHFLFEFDSGLNTLYMIDVSGSVYQDPSSFQTQIKYLTCLKENLKSEGSRIYGFSNKDYDLDIFKEFAKLDPYSFAFEISNYLIKHKHFLIGNTNFSDSVKICLRNNPNINSLIVITDEGFNAGSNNLINSNFMYKHGINNRSVIININKLPKGKTPFEQKQSFIKIYGHDGKNLARISAMFNFENFKNKIKNQFFIN